MIQSATGRVDETCSKSPRNVNPVFPGSSPWVLSVGGIFIVSSNITRNWTTDLCKNYSCATGNIESPSNFNYLGWTTGGGFAIYNTEKEQKWQKDFITKYLESGIPLPSTFSREGRGYPDISSVSHNCPVIDSNEIMAIDGTSCSSPIIASIISIINNHQLSKNKSKVGFFNPLLYKMAKNDYSLFNDIKSGNNYCNEAQCCPNRNDTGSNYGYLSTIGWDPVTGLGTPNVGKILSWLDNN